MLDFKKWIINEIVEPKKPFNSVVFKGNNDKDFSLNFKTSLGNSVSISFSIADDKYVEISFYVNGSHKETENKMTILGRDPEILPNVMFVVKNKIDELKINKVYFMAFEDDNDLKIAYKLNLDKTKQKILKECDKILRIITNKDHVLLINNFKLIISSLKNDASCLEQESKINVLFAKILSCIPNGFDSFEFYYNVNELKRQFKSYSDGTIIKDNRRVKVYTRLFERYFKDEWDLQVIGNTFLLKRKNNAKI